jgi:hypothetical protein
MSEQRATERATATVDQWPDPEPEEVEVMLLGTYHMDNPSLDAANVEADDVLVPQRQRQLQTLVDRFAPWAPDVVGVEQPTGYDDRLDEAYAAFRSGDRAFDEAAPDAPVSTRNEVVQIGFRLAAELELDGVVPVDHPLHPADRFDADQVGDMDARDLWIPDEALRETHDLPGAEAIEREQERRLRESTVTEFLRWSNTDPELREGNRGMFASAIPMGEGEDPLGPVALGAWYERNIRVVHELWRALDGDEERVLLLFGLGHVHVLRHLLDETPMFCPVSPLPFLE